MAKTDEELLIIVPARGGSRRLPGKNVRRLRGRSLLEWTAAAIKDAGLSCPCLLTTDDREIAEIGKRLGWLVPFMRPAELATDTATSESAIDHALDWYRDHHGGDPELLMVLQVTTPLRGHQCLEKGLELLMNESRLDAVIGAQQLHVAAGNVYFRDEVGQLTPLSRAPGLRPLYVPNGALYLIRTAVYRKMRTFFPPRTYPLPMTPVQSIDIDTEADWQLAEVAACLGEPRNQNNGG